MNLKIGSVTFLGHWNPDQSGINISYFDVFDITYKPLDSHLELYSFTSLYISMLYKHIIETVLANNPGFSLCSIAIKIFT